MDKSIFKILSVVLISLFLFSCGEDYPHEEEIKQIPVNFKVDRFDRAFAGATPADLPQLKAQYPLFFPRRTPDSVWVNKISDSLQREIHREVEKKFPDFKKQKKELKGLFQHFKFYFSDFEAPKRVITLTSEVDYRNKVIATDSLLLISLDVYLGTDHEFYVGMQNFLKNNFEPSQIAPDVSEAYGDRLISQPKSRSLLAQMVFYGKQLYLKDKVLPKKPDSIKIGYTPKEVRWAKANEYQIWQHIIDREILFSTRPDLKKDYINEAPFTKFGLKLDNESPPRLGRYIGWQIVRAFAEKNGEVALSELVSLPADKIFQQSNYKPEKP